jgi:hypothetical protein
MNRWESFFQECAADLVHNEPLDPLALNAHCALRALGQKMDEEEAAGVKYTKLANAVFAEAAD